MSADVNKQQSWNLRYQHKAITDPEPVHVLKCNQHLLSGCGSALDLASGLGGNAVFLAKAGYDVTAVDYSQVALEKLTRFAEVNKLAITTRLIDLESEPCSLGCYDLIVVSYYLQRKLFPAIFSAIKTGGLLFYQTFSGDAENAPGPQNAAFRLAQAELLTLCSGHELLYYREDPSHCMAENCLKGEAMIVVKRD
ncbi:MAG: methyltransferase domain-containing protein [Gammaproteobacteria bacterium]|nr:methyltransferase domain-containing protein [Gammaproteobacteria bacterium]